MPRHHWLDLGLVRTRVMMKGKGKGRMEATMPPLLNGCGNGWQSLDRGGLGGDRMYVSPCIDGRDNARATRVDNYVQ